MLTTNNPAASTPDDSLKTTRPIVVMSGPTASGKSTITRKLAEIANLEQPDAESERGTSDQARLADLRLLRWLTNRDRPAIIESTVLARLLPVDNSALIVQLTASTPVRTRRIRSRWPDSTYTQARQLLELTDATACTELRANWGIDIAQPQANLWRADLVLGCPHVRTCPNEHTCTEIVTTMLTAAYNVYENYLTDTPGVAGEEALAQFAHLLRKYPEHVRRCREALVGRVDQFNVDAWRQRMLGELDQRTGLL